MRKITDGSSDSRRKFEEIIDAEFVEVNDDPVAADHNPNPPPPYTLAEWWRDMSRFKRFLLVLGLLFVCLFAINIVRGPAPQNTDTTSQTAVGAAVPNVDSQQNSSETLGRHSIPLQCQSDEQKRVIDCLAELVHRKTETLNQWLENRLAGASKDEAVEQLMLFKRWNDNVDTACQAGAEQFGNSEKPEHLQEYWACLSQSIDEKLVQTGT